MQELNLQLKWKFTLEKTFTTAYLKAIRDKWWFAYKLSDWSLGQKPFEIVETQQQGVQAEVPQIDLPDTELAQ